MVMKATRKIIGGACLLLAAKSNDSKDMNIVKLIQTIEKELEILSRDIYTEEFQVYAALEFQVYANPKEMMPHLTRILSATGKNLFLLSLCKGLSLDEVCSNRFYVGGT
jgi:hypothetical protein